MKSGASSFTHPNDNAVSEEGSIGENFSSPVPGAGSDSRVAETQVSRSAKANKPGGLSEANGRTPLV